MHSRHSLPQRRQRTGWRAGVGALLLTLALISSGCTDRAGPESVGPLSVGPTAVPTGPGSAGEGVSRVSEDIQAVDIRVSDNGFSADRYSAQARPMRLLVSAEGGPYTLAIDNLVQPQHLDVDGTTVVSVAPSASGEFTMRLTGAAEDTATLNVRAAGQR